VALTFEEQNIIDHGVGDYHINHFIGYFDGSSLDHYQFSNSMAFPLDHAYANQVGVSHLKRSSPEAINPSDISLHLQDVLPSIFNPNSTAVMQKTRERFRQRPTLRFLGNLMSVRSMVANVEIVAPHEDWVHLSEDTTNAYLYATTLKRQPFNTGDLQLDLVAAIPPIAAWNVISDITGGFLTRLTPEDNRRHFLAGRRTWRCGFDEERQLHYFETAAFERFSEQMYVNLEDTFRRMVNLCWVETIINFSKLIGAPLTAPSTPPSGYSNQSLGGDPANNVSPLGPVYYRNATFSAADKASAETAYNSINWFAPLVNRMPSLSTAQMPGF